MGQKSKKRPARASKKTPRRDLTPKQIQEVREEIAREWDAWIRDAVKRYAREEIARDRRRLSPLDLVKVGGILAGLTTPSGRRSYIGKPPGSEI